MSGDDQSPDRTKRRAGRVRALHAVHVNRAGESETAAISAGRTLDVSPLGVAVEVLGEIEVDDTVHLAIAIEGGIVLAQGRVVRVVPKGSRLVETGIEFTEISDEDRAALAGD